MTLEPSELFSRLDQRTCILFPKWAQHQCSRYWGPTSQGIRSRKGRSSTKAMSSCTWTWCTRKSSNSRASISIWNLKMAKPWLHRPPAHLEHRHRLKLCPRRLLNICLEPRKCSSERPRVHKSWVTNRCPRMGP